jgi:hypothetical protein
MDTLGLPEALVIFGIVFLIGFALVLLVGALRSKQSRSVQRALIDRMPSEDIARLLERPDGVRLVQALSDAGAPTTSILTAVQRGIVVIVSGMGMFGAAVLTPAPMILFALAILLLFVGMGLLAAAFVTYRLAKRWRLLDESITRQDR